jgi:ADP-ribose pyrophosphatase
MRAAVIAIGLEESALSPERQFLAGPTTVGRSEIDRLLGASRSFGDGPLPTFLAATTETVGVELILLRSIAQGSSDGAELEPLVPTLEGLASDACIVPVAPPGIPWERLRTEIERIASGEDLRILVLGSHTDAHVFPLAVFLRRFLGLAHVATCPHLAGSATREAHEACFRHGLPQSGVDVLLDLEEAAEYIGMPRAAVEAVGAGPCALEPEELSGGFSEAQTRILQLLCMHWDRAKLRVLQGGYSGSLLLLAQGLKAGSQTEPVVIKVDGAPQMRREIGGYHQVKDLFGKHVPAFSYPVSVGDRTGVGMELAAMEGSPETLQDTFEAATDEAGLERFLSRLQKSLDLVSSKLYGNTSQRTAVAPYRQFGLHMPSQLEWLEENAEFVLTYHDEDVGGDRPVDPMEIGIMLRVVAANEGSIESEICIAHGDLNFQNVICDSADNVWFIDWTHCGQHPIEMDFAKMESDLKFVMTKEFDTDDLPRLKQFEEYLIGHRVPAPAAELPARLQFARWDLRFRRLLDSARRIRRACFDLKADEDWVVYRAGLLSFALHTLSFDKRRGRGECDLVQLMHALFSAEALVYDLIADDFHLRIRSERPASYPERQRISIDEAPWSLDCADYAPPYYVDEAVLAADATSQGGGWADPEDVSKLGDSLTERAKAHDDSGRPLNPRGRTGIAGRGLLGRWGPNEAIAALVTRENIDSGGTEVLLGRKVGQHSLSVPKGFRLAGEEMDSALLRVLEEDSGWRPSSVGGEVVLKGYSYDPRQTDHAWVELEARHIQVDGPDAPALFRPGQQFEDMAWVPMNEESLGKLVPAHAPILQAAMAKLGDRTATLSAQGS